MTELESNQKTWENLKPEARNMILNIDPTFTPDKFPTPVATNYDFLLNLDLYKFAEFIYEMSESNVCDYCAYKNMDKCNEGRCVGGIIEFLKKPYEKSKFDFL